MILLPRPPPQSPFGVFVHASWPDVVDPDRLHDRLRVAYPRVDLLEEARKAWAWEQAKGARGRKKAHERFLTNWMSNAAPTLAASAPGRREVIGFDDVTGKPLYREG